MIQKNKNIPGFTLLEVIIAAFLFSTIVALVAGFSAYFFKNYSFSVEEGQQVDLAKTGITEMIREIRKAQIGADGAWPLIQTDDNTLIFYADTNGDGNTDKIRYFLNGTNLNRGVTAPTLPPVTYPSQNEVVATLASNVVSTGSAIFKYYNGNWPADTVNNPLIASQRILNTRFIEVNLTISQSTNFGAAPFQISSGVAIRSMKDNL